MENNKRDFWFLNGSLKALFWFLLYTGVLCIQDKSMMCSKSIGVAKTNKRTKELRLLIYHVSTALFVCAHVRACVCVGAYEQAHAYICVSRSVHRGVFLSFFFFSSLVWTVKEMQANYFYCLTCVKVSHKSQLGEKSNIQSGWWLWKTKKHYMLRIYPKNAFKWHIFRLTYFYIYTYLIFQRKKIRRLNKTFRRLWTQQRVNDSLLLVARFCFDLLKYISRPTNYRNLVTLCSLQVFVSNLIEKFSWTQPHMGEPSQLHRLHVTSCKTACPSVTLCLLMFPSWVESLGSDSL